MFAPLTYWQEASAGGAPSQTHWLDLEQSSTQYTSITDAAQNGVLDITTSFTVEMRFKPESVGTSQYLVCKSSSGQELFQCIFSFTKNLQFETWNSSGGRNAKRTSSPHSSLATAGTEVHIAFVQDLSGSGEKYIYVDGVSQTLSLVAGAADTDLVTGTTSPFEIGALAGADTIDGLIADVRLWKVARTSTQINDNKAADIDPSSESDLVGLWYKSNTHSDETSNGNDLTATNSPVFVSYP